MPRRTKIINKKNKVRLIQSKIMIEISFFILFSDQQTKPIQIISSSNVNTKNLKPSASSFEDVHVDDSDENFISPTNEKAVHRQQNKSNLTPKRHNFNEQMLLESMLDDGDQDQMMKNKNRISQQNIDSNKGFLLLDNNEHLTVSLQGGNF